MVFFSTDTKDKIYHTHECHHAAHIKEENIGTFETEREARAAGFHACSCCSAISKAYRKEKDVVENYAYEKEMLCYLRGGEFVIITESSNWKLVSEHGRTLLYHKDSFDGIRDCNSEFPGYHLQSIFKNRLQDYLKYIHEHDIYRSEENRRRRHNRMFMENTYSVCRMKRSRYNASQLYCLLHGIAI